MPSEDEFGTPLHVHVVRARRREEAEKRERSFKRLVVDHVRRTDDIRRFEAALGKKFHNSLEDEVYRLVERAIVDSAVLRQVWLENDIKAMRDTIRTVIDHRRDVESHVMTIVFQGLSDGWYNMPDDFSKLEEEVQRRIRKELDDGVISHDHMRELVRRTSGQDIGPSKPVPVIEEYVDAQEPHDYRDGGLVPRRPRTRWTRLWAYLTRPFRAV